ncbi:MAG TPA: hypothetical protein PLV68_07605, partial [Ilumatobacteraceae bacterium]|nr:hypothetical protein [Ilumatobacteraceae bacterium]
VRQASDFLMALQLTGAANAADPAVRGARSALVLPPAPSVAGPALAGCDAPVVQALMESNPSVSQWIMVIAPAA